jgi:hypothetical protein
LSITPTVSELYRMLARLLILALLPLSVYAQGGAPTAPAQQPEGSAGARPTPAQVGEAIASVDDVSRLLQLAGELQQQGDLDSELLVWQRLIALRPHTGLYMYEMAAVLAQQDRKSETYNTLLELHATGFSYDPSVDDRFSKVSTTEVWNYIVGVLKKNGEPVGPGRVAMTLPKDDLLIESLTFDRSRGQLLVGSVREGSVSLVGSDGTLKPLVTANDENGMWGVFGVGVDVERGFLWVASTAVPHFKGYDAEADLGKAGVFKFRLSDGKFIKSFLSPVISGSPFSMTYVTVANDGAVYVADAINNALYQIRDDTFTRILHAPTLTSIRALATSDDSKILYFADSERGVFGFDLAAAKAFDIAVPPRTSLFGIEGMTYLDGHLLVVQNGLPTNRIQRLALDASGRNVVKADPISVGRTDLTMPAGATLNSDGEVLLIGNSQRDKYDRFGLPRNKDALEGAKIFSIRADSGMQAAEM